MLENEANVNYKENINYKMNIKTESIAKGISVVRASENPLSSDVIIVEGEKYFWVYDVGNNPENILLLSQLNKPVNIILSHFHPDHIGNLEKLAYSKITYNKLYQGKNTFKYTRQGIVIEEKLTIEDGISLEIFAIPSSHAKGSLAMRVGDYVFLGDAIYPAYKNGSKMYNVQLLKEQIDLLKSTAANYFAVSHRRKFICEKREIIQWLEEIYSRRDKGSVYIEVK